MSAITIPVFDDQFSERNSQNAPISKVGARYASMCPNSDNCGLEYACLVSGVCPLVELSVQEDSLEVLVV
jgi:hypothetical protein